MHIHFIERQQKMKFILRFDMNHERMCLQHTNRFHTLIFKQGENIIIPKKKQ